VTPLSLDNIKPEPPSQFARARARRNLLSQLEEVESEEQEDMGKLEEKERVRDELQRFYQEELELIKAGGDPLLTCRHCHYLFSCYRSYSKHRCQLIRREEDSDAPHFRVVEGRDRETFLRIMERLSPMRRIQACVSTRTACRGLFPLVFPDRGGASVSWLEEVACVGEQAYTSMYNALRDGELYLPEKLVLDLPEGGEIFLPASLLTPRQAVKRAELLITSEEDNFLHVELAKEKVLIEEEADSGDEEEDDDLPGDGTKAEEESDEDEDDGDVWWEPVGGGGPAQGGQAAAPPVQGGVQPAPPLGPGAPTVQDRRVGVLILLRCYYYYL